MSDIWDDFFDEFGDAKKRLQKMLENFGDSNMRTYGYTVYTGPDGVPHVHRFDSHEGTDVPPNEMREPLTDVSVDGRYVRIVVELPGVTKEDILLEGTDSSITITVDTEKRKFGKTVSLPTKVDPNSAEAEYNNGILEITLESVDKVPKTKKIAIK